MYLTGDVDKVLNLDKNVSSAVQEMLIDVGNLVSNTAKNNAPYLSGMLRKSINPNFNYVQKGYAIVGSSLKYARKREFENNKNPQTKYYLKRGYTDNESKIGRIIKEALDKKLK